MPGFEGAPRGSRTPAGSEAASIPLSYGRHKIDLQGISHDRESFGRLACWKTSTHHSRGLSFSRESGEIYSPRQWCHRSASRRIPFSRSGYVAFVQPASITARLTLEDGSENHCAKGSTKSLLLSGMPLDYMVWEAGFGTELLDVPQEERQRCG